MRALAIATLSGLAIGLAPTTLAGQAPETDGIWYGFGAGYGVTMLNCDICTNQIRSGPSVHLRAGSRLGSAALWGAEATGWFKRIEEVDQFVISLHATGYLYSRSMPGVYFKGGLGPTWFLANERGDDGDLSSLGISLVIGAGYEARLGEHTALKPYVNVVGSGFGKLNFDGDVAASPFGVAQAHLGLSLTTY